MLKIKEDVFTQTIEVNIESGETAEEGQVFFHTDDAKLPSEEQLWRRKQEKRKAVQRTAHHNHVTLYINDKFTNTLMHKKEPSNTVLRILTEQDAYPVLLIFKRQMLGLPFDEQMLATNPTYIYNCQNRKRIIIKVDILYRQY